MNDTERIQRLENELRDVKSELARLALVLRELSDGSDRRRESIQTAVNGIQHSLDAIFANVKVANVRHNPGLRYKID